MGSGASVQKLGDRVKAARKQLEAETAVAEARIKHSRLAGRHRAQHHRRVCALLALPAVPALQ